MLGCGVAGGSRSGKPAAVAGAADTVGVCKPGLLPVGGGAVSAGGAGQEVQHADNGTGDQKPWHSLNVQMVLFFGSWQPFTSRDQLGTL